MKPLYTPKLIRASAGTGKTYALANRFLHLIISGEHPEKILATTFTRKAASEIRERVFKNLANAALNDESAEKLKKELKINQLTKEKAQHALRRLVNNQHRLNICTLDSVFFKIAAIFGSELGLAQSWTIADETTNQKVRREAVRALCGTINSDELVRLLLRISGGVYVSGIEKRIVREVTVLHQLFCESKKEAWFWNDNIEEVSDNRLKELKQEFLNLELPKNKDGKVSQFWRKARDQGYEYLQSRNWLDFCRHGFGAATIKKRATFQSHDINEEQQELFRNLLSYVRSQVLNFVKEQTAASYNLLASYDHEYQRQRQLEHSLGFDDIKQKLVHASFLERLDEVYYRLDSKIFHLLLDEFQDTSNSEWYVLAPIVDEVLSKAESEYSFFCVGDIKQAIYGWRGGNASIFNYLKARWQQIDIEPLNMTYRCAPAIVNCVNKVFSTLIINPALKDNLEVADKWQKEFCEHKSYISDYEGYVELRVVTLDYNDNSSNNNNGRITNNQRKDVILKEAAYQIKDLVSAHPQSVIGVLTRTNSSVAKLVQILAHEDIGISASEEGKSPLLSSISVQLVLSAFKVAQHPGDTISAFHVATSPLGISVGFINYNCSSDRIEFSRNVRDEIQQGGFGVLVNSFVQTIRKIYNFSEQKKLKQLSELAYQFDRKESYDIDEFIRFIETEVVEDNSVAQVRVMTIHQAKGLEFDIVVLPDLIDNFASNGRDLVLTDHADPMLPPHRICRAVSEPFRSLDSQLERMSRQRDKARVNESLCLLYVALTRARIALFILTTAKVESSSLNSTFSDVLLGALKESEGQIAYRCGDPNFRIPYKEGDNNDIQVLLQTPQIKVPERQSRTLLCQNPSELEGSNVVEINRILNFDNREQRQHSIELGLIVHRIFEQMRWLEDYSIDELEIEASIHNLNYDANLVKEAMLLVKNVLVDPEVSRLYKKDSYGQDKSVEIQVYLEYPFVFRVENRLISGVIDRLVVVAKNGKALRAEIIDYKTDNVDSSNIIERSNFYLQQMEAYRSAVQKITGIEMKDISVKLVFVRLLQVVKL